MRLTLDTIISQTDDSFKILQCPAEARQTNIEKITPNSKAVIQNSIYVCQKGIKTDGHNYIQEAINKGAIAIVGEVITDSIIEKNPHICFLSSLNTKKALGTLAATFYGKPANNLMLVGVTGTDGKTTVTNIIETILSASKQKTCLLGSLGYHSTYYKNFPLGIIAHQANKMRKQIVKILNILSSKKPLSGYTTLPAHYLQMELAKYRSRNYNPIILEVSSHGLEQERVSGCQFSVAVLTNITEEHIDYHGSMQEYAKAKGKLFSMLNGTAEKPALAVINIDCSEAHIITASCAPYTNIMTYSLNNTTANLYAKNITYTGTGTYFTCVSTTFGEFDVTTKLYGEFNVYNALAAIATAIGMSIKPKTIQKALKTFSQPVARFQTINQKPRVIIDFAHTPNALKNVLQTARNITSANGKLIALTSYNTDWYFDKNIELARVLKNYADYALLTTHNVSERQEKQTAFLNTLRTGLQDNNIDIPIETNHFKAIQKVLAMANKNDTVVITGRGEARAKESWLNINDQETVLLSKLLKLFKPQGQY